MDIIEHHIDVDKAKVNDFIIPDPNDELNRMYIISIISETIGIRAEREYSPEHHIPEKERKMGIQNENYTEFVKLIDTMFKEQSVQSFRVVEDFIRKYLKSINKISLFPKYDTIQYWTNERYDVRLTNTVAEWFSYCVTKIVKDLEESKKYDQLDNWIETIQVSASEQIQ